MFAFLTAEWDQTVSKNITLLLVLPTSEKLDNLGKAAGKGVCRCHIIDLISGWNNKYRDNLQRGLNRDGFFINFSQDTSWVISEVSEFHYNCLHWNIFVILRPSLMNYPNFSECVWCAPYYSYFIPIYYLPQWKSSFQIPPPNHS